MMTIEHVGCRTPAMSRDSKAGYLSIFAGRVADAGVDPIMAEALELMKPYPQLELVFSLLPEEDFQLHASRSFGLPCHHVDR